MNFEKNVIVPHHSDILFEIEKSRFITIAVQIINKTHQTIIVATTFQKKIDRFLQLVGIYMMSGITYGHFQTNATSLHPHQRMVYLYRDLFGASPRPII